jgi:hypothetical protein
MEWADQTVIDALQPHVEKIQEALAEITCQPGILSAFVSDESSICDFLDDREEKGTVWDEKLKRNIMTVSYNTDKNCKIVGELSIRLGVAVDIYDRVYEVAIKLRDNLG